VSGNFDLKCGVRAEERKNEIAGGGGLVPDAAPVPCNANTVTSGKGNLVGLCDLKGI